MDYNMQEIYLKYFIFLNTKFHELHNRRLNQVVNKAMIWSFYHPAKSDN